VTGGDYSASYDVLGYMVEVASGKPSEVFLREKIFQPLRMKDTGFHVPAESTNRFGPLYTSDRDGGFDVADPPTPSPFLDPDIVPSGGGGLISTPNDYLLFLDMLTHGSSVGTSGCSVPTR
jgi:CubicO group peptidase (beta-lactamase class C family)